MTGTTGTTRESKNFSLTCARGAYSVAKDPHSFFDFFCFFLLRLTLDGSMACYSNLENEKSDETESRGFRSETVTHNNGDTL